MKPLLIVSIIWSIVWLSISYSISHKNYPKLSSYVDTKTVHWIKPAWVVVTTKTYCKWSCTNSYDDWWGSSWWSSSFGGGK